MSLALFLTFRKAEKTRTDQRDSYPNANNFCLRPWNWPGWTTEAEFFVREQLKLNSLSFSVLFCSGLTEKNYGCSFAVSDFQTNIVWNDLKYVLFWIFVSLAICLRIIKLFYQIWLCKKHFLKLNIIWANRMNWFSSKINLAFLIKRLTK